MSDKPLGGAGKPRMPWYPLFERDFTADTATWPVEAVGALIRLMNYQWHNGTVPWKQDSLARIAGCHDSEQWKRIWDEFLSPKFEEEDPLCCLGPLVNRRLQAERQRIEKKGKQAKKAAEKRWENQTDNADAHADAMQTKNQEPRTKNKTVSPAARVIVPYEKIVALYHEHCPDLPRVKVLSAKRKGHLRSRWQTFEVMRGLGKPGQSLELIKFSELRSWERYFKFITEGCPFLIGKNEKSWRADFDFCIRESAMVNVMENKYVERK